MSKRKPYTRQMGATWWLKNTFHTKYIIREGSSLAIVAYSLILLTGLFRLNQGEVAFNAWLECMSSPLWILFHIGALAWTLYHTITWFSLAPKAAELWMGEKRVPDCWIIKALYGTLAAVSIIALLLVFFL